MYTIFSKLSENLNTITDSMIMEQLYEFSDVTESLEVLQREQMLNNKDSEGTSFGGYKKGTENRNTKRVTKVTAGDPIILKDTGAFQSKIKAVVDKDTAKLTSTDDKRDLVTKMYGEEVFGLSEEYMKHFRAYVASTGLIKKILIDQIRY